ncbi:nucleotidyltransferase domain-containing protein [Candidatus Woesearchaeota archaeon]|nr:nucleotidyltransferase domain-containing protein [Candidatus Woesearchaeota archaeon]
MRSKETEIIRYLLKNKEGCTINKIAQDIKKDYKTTHNIVKRLETEKIISIETFGKASKVTINNIVHPLIYQAEWERQQEMLKNKNIKTILAYYKRSIIPFYILLLFGSHAKETQTKHSDIDLFFIIPEEKMEKDILRTTSLIPLKIHANIFTEKQFKEMKNSREQTVGSEVIKKNIILYGIEAYYELMQ